MKLRTRSLSLATALMLVLSMFAFLPRSAVRTEALGTITNLYISDANQKIGWDAYPNAVRYRVGYYVDYKQKYETVTKNELDYSSLLTQKGKVYRIHVDAWDSSDTKIAASEYRYYAIPETISGVSITADYTVSWSAFSGDFDNYIITVASPDGAARNVIGTKGTSLNIKSAFWAMPSGKISYTVKAVKSAGDGEVVVARSATKTFNYTSTDVFITTTTATVTKPVAGKTPYNEAKIALNNGTVDWWDAVKTQEVQWFDASGNQLFSTAKFVSGKTYKARLIITLEEGYYLDYNVWQSTSNESFMNGTAVHMTALGTITKFYMERSFTATDTVQPDTLSNLRIDYRYIPNMIYWDAYPGAHHYHVYYKTANAIKEFDTTETKVDCSKYFTSKAFVYPIQITARDGDDNSLTSNDPLYYCDEGTISDFSITLKDLYATWKAYKGDFSYYRISIISTKTNGPQAETTTTYNFCDLQKVFASLPTGEYTVRVLAVADTDNYRMSIAHSGTVTINYTSTSNFVTYTEAAIARPFAGTYASNSAGFVLNNGNLSSSCIKSYELKWYDVSANKQMTSSDVFVSGRQYKAVITVTLSDGTYLDYDTAKSSQSINNSTINNWGTHMNNVDGRRVYSMEKTFTSGPKGTLTGLAVDYGNKKLTWNAYNGASKYLVTYTVAGSTFSETVTGTSYSFGSVFTAKGRIYDITVTARDGAGYDLTAPAPCTYVCTGTIIGLNIDAGVNLRWEKFNGDVDRYHITVLYPDNSGGSPSDTTLNYTSLKNYFASLPSGVYKIRVIAKADRNGTELTTAVSEYYDYNYHSTADFVTSADVSVEAPVAGKRPGTAVWNILNKGGLDPASCVDSSEVTYYDAETGEKVTLSETFVKGKTYKVLVKVDLKNNTYLSRDAANNMDLKESTLNGVETHISNLNGYKSFRLEAELECLNSIDTLAVTVTEPKNGVKVTDTAAIVVPGIVSSGARWYDGTGKFLTTSDKFADGNTYTVEVGLDYLDYASGKDVTRYTEVTINGKKAVFKRQEGKYTVFTVTFSLGGMKGDVDGSGVINMKDLATLQRYVNGWDVTINEANSDLDSSGSINMKDVAALQRLINSM